jgi:D-glycero-D-manno-heptose 1,7-bisphosphate phosphatase
MSRPAVFLDRDGVLIENQPEYVRSWSQVEFLPGSIKAIEQLNASGYVIVMVTNQSVVGRGIISLEEARRINQQVVDEVAVKGGRIDASYMCPHGPEDGCRCRKPAPGMLLQAAAELDLALSRSYMVGDALSDVEAGRSAGVASILVQTGRGNEQARLASTELEAKLPIVADLPAAVRYILLQEGKTR